MELSDEQFTTLRQKLELPEEATPDQVVDAVTKVVDESLEERPAPANELPAAPALKEGQIVVSQAAWDDMKEKAEAGSGAATSLHAMTRKTALDGLRNRFLPAARKRWEDEYDKDPEATVKYLTESPVIIPDNLLGHGGDGEDTAPKSVKDDPGYKNWRM